MSKRRGEEHDDSSQISGRCYGSWRETNFLSVPASVSCQTDSVQKEKLLLYAFLDSGKNHPDVTYCTLSQHISSHFEKDRSLAGESVSQNDNRQYNRQCNSPYGGRSPETGYHCGWKPVTEDRCKDFDFYSVKQGMEDKEQGKSGMTDFNRNTLTTL